MSQKSADRFSKNLSNESGQGFVEYLLILLFALSTSLVLARTMGRAMDSGILLFGGTLEADLKTGRNPLNGWRN